MASPGKTSRAVWMRIIPIIVIAIAGAGLCAQAACSGGGGDVTYGSYQ
jgi:hypothetical protein